MSDTRDSTVEKAHAVEARVMGLVHDATSAVAETVQTGKELVRASVESVRASVGSVGDVVQSSVASVRHSLDPLGHIRRHPWAAVVGAVAIGFVCGRLFARRQD